jgi:hypothetical protein
MPNSATSPNSNALFTLEKEFDPGVFQSLLEVP